MSEPTSALAALRAADPARDIPDTPWRGSPAQLAAAELPDLVDVHWSGDAPKRRRLAGALLAAAAVAALALGIGLYVLAGHRSAPPTLHKPTDPHQLKAQAWVHAELSRYPLPPNSDLLTDPPSYLRNAVLYPSGDRIVSETRYCRAPGSIKSTAHWFRAHILPDLSDGGTGRSTTGGVLEDISQRYDAGPIITGKQRVISLLIVPYRSGVAFRITTWADWTPTR